jgi:hypothetical protein
VRRVAWVDRQVRLDERGGGAAGVDRPVRRDDDPRPLRVERGGKKERGGQYGEAGHESVVRWGDEGQSHAEMRRTAYWSSP